MSKPNSPVDPNLGNSSSFADNRTKSPDIEYLKQLALQQKERDEEALRKLAGPSFKQRYNQLRRKNARLEDYLPRAMTPLIEQDISEDSGEEPFVHPYIEELKEEPVLGQSPDSGVFSMPAASKESPVLSKPKANCTESSSLQSVLSKANIPQVYPYIIYGRSYYYESGPVILKNGEVEGVKIFFNKQLTRGSGILKVLCDMVGDCWFSESSTIKILNDDQALEFGDKLEYYFDHHGQEFLYRLAEAARKRISPAYDTSDINNFNKAAKDYYFFCQPLQIDFFVKLYEKLDEILATKNQSEKINLVKNLQIDLRKDKLFFRSLLHFYEVVVRKINSNANNFTSFEFNPFDSFPLAPQKQNKFSDSLMTYHYTLDRILILVNDSINNLNNHIDVLKRNIRKYEQGLADSGVRIKEVADSIFKFAPQDQEEEEFNDDARSGYLAIDGSSTYSLFSKIASELEKANEKQKAILRKLSTLTFYKDLCKQPQSEYERLVELDFNNKVENDEGYILFSFKKKFRSTRETIIKNEIIFSEYLSKLNADDLKRACITLLYNSYVKIYEQCKGDFQLAFHPDNIKVLMDSESDNGLSEDEKSLFFLFCLETPFITSLSDTIINGRNLREGKNLPGADRSDVVKYAARKEAFSREFESWMKEISEINGNFTNVAQARRRSSSYFHRKEEIFASIAKKEGEVESSMIMTLNNDCRVQSFIEVKSQMENELKNQSNWDLELLFHIGVKKLARPTFLPALEDMLDKVIEVFENKTSFRYSAAHQTPDPSITNPTFLQLDAKIAKLSSMR